MGQILVWRCDTTGRLFEHKAEYQRHLRKMARERSTKRRLAIVEAESDAWWNAAWETDMSIEAWPAWVIANQDRFWAATAQKSPRDWKNVGKAVSRKKNACVLPIPVVLEFSRFELRWSTSVSNSHSCPHDGVTCWSSHEARDGRPRGYPGWHGRVEWLVSWPEEYDGIYLGSDLFEAGTQVRVHTGSGGGGGMRFSDIHGCHVQRFGYELRLYASDWPGMAREEGRRQFIEVLKGERQAIDRCLADSVVSAIDRASISC